MITGTAPERALVLGMPEASSADSSSEASNSSPLDRIKLGFKGLQSSIKAATAGSEAATGSACPADSASEDGKSVASTAAKDVASVFAWAKRAVVDKVSYDVVPQGDRANAAGSTPDVEKGEGQPVWASWAQKVHQKVAEAAEETQKGLKKGVQKAKSLEFGEQAKDWHKEVAKGFGRVADTAANAGASLQEKGKAASVKAMDLKEKSAEKLKEAKSKAADKAREAKDKAAQAAGAAKDKLGSVGSGMGGFAALTMSPVKLAQFVGLFFLGCMLLTLSFSFIPVLPISPQKFALLFAFGSMTILSSLSILKGPKAFAAQLIKKDKLPFSGSYIVGLVGTLWATLIMRSFIFTAIFGLVQAFALMYFLASYIPGGKAVLNCCGRGCSRAARTIVCRAGRGLSSGATSV